MTIPLSAIRLPFGSATIIKFEPWAIAMAKSIAKSIKRAIAVTEQEETAAAEPKLPSSAFVASQSLADLSSIPQITKEVTKG